MDKKYEIHLCKKCIQDLEEYYPYLIPREQLRIVEVTLEECDNSNLDEYNERLRQRNPGVLFRRNGFMTGKDEPVVVMATNLMLAASQQGLDLNIGEAGIILDYLEGHEYCLVIDGEGRLLRHDEQYGTDHGEDMPYTIQDAILFCQDMNEDLIRDIDFWGSPNKSYLSQLRQDEQTLAALTARCP